MILKIDTGLTMITPATTVAHTSLGTLNASKLSRERDEIAPFIPNYRISSAVVTSFRLQSFPITQPFHFHPQTHSLPGNLYTLGIKVALQSTHDARD